MEVDIGDENCVHVPAIRILGDDDRLFYPSYSGLGTKIEQRLQDIKNLTLRNDDVFISSYQRSGTHWMYEVVSMLLAQKAELQKGYVGQEAMLHKIPEKSFQCLDERPSPRVLTSHIALQQLPKELTDIKPRIIYVLRNPKDAMVSMYRSQHGRSLDAPDKFAFPYSWDDYFKICGSRGGLFYGGWFRHILAMEEFKREHPECHISVVLYEDLKQKTGDTIRAVAKILGVDPHIAKDVEKASNIDNMKKAPGIQAFSRNNYKKGADGIVGTGQIGRWRELFTKAQSDEFDQNFLNQMAESELARLVQPYMVF